MHMLKISLTLFFIFIYMSSLGYSMQDTETLYSGMDYKTIFDQRRVLAKHPEALEQEGLKAIQAFPKKRKDNCFSWFFHKVTCGCFRDNNDLEEFSFVENESPVDSIPFDQEKSKTLNNALIQDFKTKKRDAMKRTLGKPIFSLLVDGGIFGAGWKFLPSEGAGFTTYVCLQIFSDNVKLFSKAVYSIYVSPLGDPLGRYEEQYAKCKRFLSPALQDTIEDNLGAARKSDQSIADTLKFCNLALNIPLTSKGLRMPDQKELKKLLKGYEPNIIEPVQDQLFNHYMRFSHSITPSEFPKSVIYLQGPPGVGKSYIAKELARLMGADFIKLKVSKKGGSDKFLGNEQEPGSFLEAIARPDRSRHAVVFIDEFDRLISGTDANLDVFLPFLEPMTTDFDSPYLKSTIDISHFFFILAGNELIKDEAMASRPELISIMRMKSAFKRKIIEEKFFPCGRKSPCHRERIDIDGIINELDYPGVRELISKVTKEIRKAQMEERQTNSHSDPVSSSQIRQRKSIVRK